MSNPRINVTRPDDQPGALYIEFDNQPAMNAFTMDIWRELIRVLRDARIDDSVRVVILSGAGERAFSSGISMDEFDSAETDDEYAVFYNVGLEVREAIFALGKPIIAAIRGLCVGGGFELTLCCDLVYAAEGSKFMLPEINIGVTPGCGGAINLAAKIPLNRAMEIILLGERIPAEEMKALGLVNRIFPADTFWDDVRAIVGKLLAKPPLALRGVKEILTHANVTVNEGAAFRAERKLALDMLKTHDFNEAVTAFREKREPKFIGK